MRFEKLCEELYRLIQGRVAATGTLLTEVELCAALCLPQERVTRAVSVLQKDGRLTRTGLAPTPYGDYWLNHIRAENAHLEIVPLQRRKPLMSKAVVDAHAQAE